jgi:hypothetical protein
MSQSIAGNRLPMLARGLLIAACLAVAGCSESEDAAAQDDTAQRDEGSGRAAVAAEADDDLEAWFLSAERPVNRACNDPDYRPGQPDTYPMLHSHLYPVIQERLQDLLAQVQALAPKVTDEDTYDLEADLALRREINVLNQLVFLAGQDQAPLYLLSVCDIPNYEADECALTRRMASSAAVLQDFDRDGPALSYDARLLADGSQFKIRITNRDLDGIVLNRLSGPQGTYTGEWQRAEDGTETYSAHRANERFSYTEKPDCSGVAQALRMDAGGQPWELSWRWTSVRQPDTFTVQYQECKVNGLDERECISGAL